MKSDSDLSDLDKSLEELDQEDQQEQQNGFDGEKSDQSGSSSESSSDSDSEKEEGKGEKDEKGKNKKNFEKEKDVGYGDHLIANEDVSEKPPLVVVVQGPKQSGKSTLIKSLVKHYTRHKLQTINGNITIRAGKNQRLTFIECPSDVNSMIDLAKIADMALILIDVSIGFEMETFEFISILRSHGFPNVMGVQTHMDYFKENKTLSKAKKRYKKRFEYEVGSDYKLFTIPGIQSDGLYPRRDVINLARYLSIIKYAQVPWKMNHPYIVPDRWENNDAGPQITPDDQDISVSFYGYVRGCSYRTNSRVHLIGLGDYDIKKVEILEDPCPNLNKEDKALIQGIPSDSENEDNNSDNESENGDKKDEKNQENNTQFNKEKSEKQKKNSKRTLTQKERIIYAPYSNLGYLNYEKTGGYITIPDKYVYYTRQDKAENLNQDGDQQIDEEEAEQRKQLEDEKSNLEGVKMMRELQDMKRIKEEDEEDDEDIDLLTGVKVKNDDVNLKSERQIKQEERQIQDEDQRKFNQKQKEIMNLKHKTQNIQKLKHAQSINDQMLSTDLHDLIYGNDEKVSQFDSSRFSSTKGLLSRDKYKLAVKKQFMAGSGYGDVADFGDPDSESEDEKEKIRKDQEKQEQEKLEIQQQELKNRNGATIDNYMDGYLGIYKKGTYIKMDLSIKYKHFKQFSPDQTLILARINPGEDTFGFLKTRFKKHRWYGSLLKSKDPLIISMGWRRYQTIPVFCTEDQDVRTRYLKYTPQHDYCTAIFYGNFAPQNTGFVCTQTLNNKLEKFRLSGTGTVVELNHQFDVMKKLKLIGEPFKIYKNSAFIKGMFNSALEVSKFEGAMIKTVSGIRGQIKKSVKEGGEGCYRATFEDKIIKSDLVFLRTWFKIPLQKFYNPIVSFEKMRLMKTTWELRKERSIKLEQNKDSLYKEIERPDKKFKDDKISRNLQAALPFKTQEKVKSMSRKEKLARKEDTLPIKSLTSDKEKQAFALIQRLNTIRNEKEKIKQVKKVEKNKIKAAQKQGEMKKYEPMWKEKEKQKNRARFGKKKIKGNEGGEE